ncbi:MAG: HEAT repeat domain-containing protein [Planctomycetaceae bacterium]
MPPEKASLVPGEIQLHFCQRCGISIPVTEVASGRATAAPGGYVCSTCTSAEAPATGAPVSARQGLGAVAVAALLFLVGATAFLLYRETTRTAPVLKLPPTAAPEDVAGVSRRLEEAQQRSREGFVALSEALQAQQQRIDALRRDQAEAEQAALDREKASLERDRNLLAAIDALASRTGISRGDLTEILAREMEKFRREAAAQKTTQPTPTETPKQPDPPPVDPRQAEQDRLVREYVLKLQSKEATPRERYTAAVRLGELMDPSAITPLIQVLESDEDDLVLRGAAWSLGKFGKVAVRAIPALIKQVGEKREYVGYMCDRALSDISLDALGARITFGYDPTMTSKQRRAIEKQWEEWWTKNRPLLEREGGSAGAG